ncbi:MAG: glycoside hydrolase family 3 C-terminal domain-containing protein [Candidatus Coproplasma sp.]
MNAHSKLLKKRSLCCAAAVLSLFVASSGLFTTYASADCNEYYVDGMYEECLDVSRGINKEIMEEGMALLKNRNGALPLAQGSRISLFGVGSYFTNWGETGAGNGKTDYVYMKDSLKAAGFAVNPEIESVYSALSESDKVALGSTNVLLDPPVSKLDGVKSSYSSYNDAAIITISRTGKESGDLEISGLQSAGWATDADHQLMLNVNEKALIEAVKAANFGKIIVLVNCPTSMQIPELDADDKIDAIMYIGMPGQYGLEALGGVLNGEVSPSGRTVTAWAADFTKSPTFANVATKTGSIDGVASVEYEEGIYLGYKYYETAFAEAQNGNYTGFDYDAEVVYPFGYGLSYTTFSQKLLTDNYGIVGKSFDDYIDVKVEVTNTGTVAGKEVVQIYSHAPYYENGIEKSEVVLVGFAKTGLIASGESQTVTVSVRVGDLASFDWNDANGDNWYGYETEAGDYELRLQKNSHEVIDKIEFTVENTVTYNNDGSIAALTGTVDKSNLAFSNGDDFDSLYLATEQNGGNFRIMSRTDFAGTFPTAPTGTVSYDKGLNTEYTSIYTPDMDSESDPWYVSADEIPDYWTQGSGTYYKLSDLTGIDYTSEAIIADGTFAGKTGVEAWTEFMNCLTWDELKDIIRAGSHQTIEVASVGKPAQVDKDGPEQLSNGTFWACANIIAGTWNEELIERRGEAIGNEALYQGITGWYGPAANLNRSPFGGRNVIYSSEDALLSGKVAAANIRGAQSRGLVAYLKHFALNEQETERTGLATFLTEQALRETYLKAFEYAVKESQPLGIMQAMNRIGGVNCYGNYALDVTVLRNEWGFKGAVLTDAYNALLIRENMHQRMGGDFPLGTYTVAIAGDWDASKNTVTYNGAESPTQWSVVRNAAMHILYMSANSNVFGNGYDLISVTSKTYGGNLTFSLNKEIESIDASIDTAKFGTDNVVYSATNLPEGLTIDPETGIISGTPTATTPSKNNPTVVITVTVQNQGEKWISAKYNLGKIVVEDNGGSSVGGCGSISTSIGPLITSLLLICVMISAVGPVLRRKEKISN